MLSLEECRRLLPPSVQLDDEELEKIRQQLYTLCTASYEALAQEAIESDDRVVPFRNRNRKGARSAIANQRNSETHEGGS